MPIRGITLDLEGTIIDAEGAHHEGHLATASELGLKLGREEAIAAIPGFVGGGDEAVAAGLFRLASSPPPVDQILMRLKYHYNQRLKHTEIVPRPYFCGRMQELLAKRLPVAIGSLTPRSEAEVLLERAGLTRLLSALPMIFREDVVHVKPDPEVFQRTARILGIPVDSQLVIEDSPVGVVAAVAAGSVAVALPVLDSPPVRESLLRAGARLVLSGWEAVDVESLLQLEGPRRDV